MLDLPLVSVIMPVHNGGSYLSIALASLVAQTFTDFELLALDDGSTDGSLAILRAFEARDARVRVWSRENKGLVETLNELIGKARGRYLARMDADDVCRLERFSRQFAFLDSNPQVVGVGSRALLIDQQGRPICETQNEPTHAEIDEVLLKGDGGVRGLCHPSFMARSEAVRAVGGYRAEFRHAEDIDHFLRLGEIGLLANLQEVLLEYRQHLGSIGYAHKQEQARASRRAVEAAIARRGIESTTTAPQTVEAPRTVADAHCKWAWWALMAGNVRTARMHALQAFARRPLDIEHMKLAACVIRGY